MVHSIREAIAKKLLRLYGDLAQECVLVDMSTDLDSLPIQHSWLLCGNLVLKPDVLLKRRGEHGLVHTNIPWHRAKELLKVNLGREIIVENNLKGNLSHFIIEPYFPHDEGAEEMYLAIRTLREYDEIIFTKNGGINVGNVEEKSRSLKIPVEVANVLGLEEDEINVNEKNAFSPTENDNKLTEILKDSPSSKNLFKKNIEKVVTYSQLSALFLDDIKNDAMRDAMINFTMQLYNVFYKLHFSYLEINPLSYDREKNKVIVLDCAAKLDNTAEFLCERFWSGIVDFPSPFGRALTQSEQYVRELDSKTGASLKLTILNPLGRIWLIIAGGGASVIYADTVCDLGFDSELANYGEYSGAPSELTTYEYTRTIIKAMTAPETYRQEGKILLIGGGIANFTSVADTFKGIRRALLESQSDLREFKTRVYVRRGGPNYEEGLKIMREVGKEINIPVKVYGPETYITAIIKIALEDDIRYNNNSVSSSCKPNITMDTLNDQLNNVLFSSDSTAHHAGNFNVKHNNLTGPSKESELIQNKWTNNFLKGSFNLGKSYTAVTNQVQDSLWPEEKLEDVEINQKIENDIKYMINKANENRVNSNMKPFEIFTRETCCAIWGLQTRAVQEMLDFDHVCGRSSPSVKVIIYEFSVSHLRPFYFGTEEIFIPVCSSLEEAVEKHKNVDTLINFASMRSAAAVTLSALKYNNIKTIAIIAEGIPERLTRELIAESKKRNVTIIGPATVGGLKPGCFRIGNTGGSLENIMNAKLYRPGSVGFVTKSGGMLNELNNTLSIVADGTYEGVAIGGDRYPCTTMLDHLLRYEQCDEIKMMVILGEVGGIIEYEVVDAIRRNLIKKPIVAWCVGTCAPFFSTEVSFGHAGTWATNLQEHSASKNKALKEVGCYVPESFQTFGAVIGRVYQELLEKKIVERIIEPEIPRVPIDYAWAKKLGLVRKPKGFISSISDDRGEELVYAGWPISRVFESNMGLGGVISLLWFKRPLPSYAYTYLENVLMLCADHGPAVCGAHNTIVTARAGKDLISSLISGLLTIGDRFGGACDKAAKQFLRAFQNNVSPEIFVKEMKRKNQLIMGIGHKIKSVHNLDMRVQLLKNFCKKNFPQTKIINYAEDVEKLTTKKKDTLILNVDGLLGASMCDLLFGCGAFSDVEAEDFIENGCINGLFVLGRSIGFIGHYLDQKRLKQGLYRHDVDDISYVLPELEKK